jgi:hypothetical protein
LGAQLVGRLCTEVSKRVETYATALFHDMTVAQLADLNLSYTPPLGSPWDAVQMAAQQWESGHHQQDRDAMTHRRGRRAGQVAAAAVSVTGVSTVDATRNASGWTR